MTRADIVISIHLRQSDRILRGHLGTPGRIMKLYTRAAIAALAITATLGGCAGTEQPTATPIKLVGAAATPSTPLISTSTVDPAAEQAAQEAADAQAAAEAKAAADAK